MCVEGGKDLEGSSAFKASVLCPVNETHAAFAKLFEDFVVGYGLADHGKTYTGV